MWRVLSLSGRIKFAAAVRPLLALAFLALVWLVSLALVKRARLQCCELTRARPKSKCSGAHEPLVGSVLLARRPSRAFPRPRATPLWRRCVGGASGGALAQLAAASLALTRRGRRRRGAARKRRLGPVAPCPSARAGRGKGRRAGKVLMAKWRARSLRNARALPQQPQLSLSHTMSEWLRAARLARLETRPLAALRRQSCRSSPGSRRRRRRANN